MSEVAEIATLAYGYTMADVERIARLAVRLRGNRLLDTDEAQYIAWHGVIVALYEAIEPPPRRDLIAAGSQALSSEIKKIASFEGFTPDGGLAPRFQVYWSVRHGLEDDFTERIAERLSLPAALSTLTGGEYEALTTLAAFDGDMGATARALDIERGALTARLVKARRKIKAVWFEHETPRAWKSMDPDKCRNGHSRAEHGYRDDLGRWVCDICRRSINRRADRRSKARRRQAALA